MTALEFPAFQFKIKEETGKEIIFDEVRRKWVRLTPEEWVRQNVLQYILQVKKYPAALLAIEKEILLGELRKRCDIIVYKDAQPWMIVECKEMGVPLSEAVLMQMLRYNIKLGCSYLVITNGSFTKGWQVCDGGKVIELANLPDW